MAGTSSTYPPDVVTEQPSPLLSYDSATDTIYDGSTPVTQAEDLSYNHEDYGRDIDDESFNFLPPIGHYQRREVAIPIGDCSATTNGSGEVPVLGFGCYFLLQEALQKGNESHVFGQFVENCSSGGIPGPAPVDSPGLYIIQLYKDPDSPDA
jgi:hypothetical protein